MSGFGSHGAANSNTHHLLISMNTWRSRMTDRLTRVRLTSGSDASQSMLRNHRERPDEPRQLTRIAHGIDDTRTAVTVWIDPDELCVEQDLSTIVRLNVTA